MATRAVSKQYIPPVLPYVTKFCKGTLSVIVQDFDMKYFDEVKKIFFEAAEKGDGYSLDEMTDEFFHHKLCTGRPLLYLEESTKDIISVMPVNGSPVSRSNKPFVGSVAVVVPKKHRGKGAVVDAYFNTFDIMVEQGYIATTTRNSISTRNFLAAEAIGCTISGTIPYCSYIDKVGYLDNVIMYVPYNVQVRFPDYYQELVDSRKVPIPKLNTEESVVSRLVAGTDLPTKEVKTKKGMLKIRPARDVTDILEAEQMWRSAAERGQGFGIDEFDENGHFNRKFFKSSDIVVAESTNGEIVGAAIQGPSKLARSVITILAQQYMAVKESHTKQGIASALLNYSVQTLGTQGYKAMISDTYLKDFLMVNMLKNRDFIIRGSFPYCGFMDGRPMDSLIVYRKL